MSEHIGTWTFLATDGRHHHWRDVRDGADLPAQLRELADRIEDGDVTRLEAVHVIVQGQYAPAWKVET